MTNEKAKTWVVEGESKVSFQLNQHHKLCIERTFDGLTLRVFDERGHKHKPEEPVLLYSNKISDLQLGYLEVIEK